ncbi:MAG: hypothetical protein RR840_01635 [Clostridium sp.]
MGIFSLFFKGSDSLVDEDTNVIETVETISNKVQVVYESGFLYKSENSYIPNVDVMEVAVPTGMDVFKDEYTVYSTEKTISDMMQSLSFNIAIRKEIHLHSYGNYPSSDCFEEISILEAELLDVSFIQQIIDNEITKETYEKLRTTLINTFNECGKTDPYFKSMHSIFSDYFTKNTIDNMISLVSRYEATTSPVLYTSTLKYINTPLSAVPSEDIMAIGEVLLRAALSNKYNYDTTLKILCNIVNRIHMGIQERIQMYQNITPLEYLYEIDNGIIIADEYLISLIDKQIIDETTYLTIQDVLVDMFYRGSNYDLYVESIATKLGTHIEKNNLFKQYICKNLYNIFEK